MRFFLTADLQLRNFTEFSSLTPGGYNSRLFRLLNELTRLIEENGPFDGIILAGDIWNNKAALETDLLDLVHQTFQFWHKRVPEIITLLGNHDTAFLSTAIHSLRQFEAYGPVITQAQLYQGIAFSPWRPTTEEIERDIASLSGKAKILIGHWTVKGAAMNQYQAEGGIDPMLPALRDFSLVLLGDVHKSQRLGKNIRYLGSPAQNDFGDEGDTKRVWILDSAKVEIKSIPTQLPEYKTVESLEEAQNYRAKGYYVRLKAKSREALKEGTAAGLRVEQDYTESVAAADSVRALVTTLEEAVKAYAIANGREDLLERGLAFLSGALEKRTLPPVKLNFHRLQAENFLSYQSLDWDLSARTGFVIVHGEVISDAGYDSNGAGKTALYEALYYALYGVTLRYGTRKDLTIREGEKKNSVSVAFEVTLPDKNTFNVRISRSRPGTVKLVINEADITSNDANLTQRAINELIGPPEFFLRLTLLALSYHPSFLRLADADKKRFIDEFSGLDAFSEARETVHSQLATVEVEERRVQFEHTRIAERQTLLAHRVEEIAKELTEFETTERQALAERKAEMAAYRKELASLEPPPMPVLPEKCEQPEPPPKRIFETKKLSQEIAEHETTINAARKALEKQRKVQAAALAPLYRQEVEQDNELKTLRQGLMSDKCPTCLRPFNTWKENNRPIHARIDALENQHTTVRTEIDRSETDFEKDNAEFVSEIQTLENHVHKLYGEISWLKDAQLDYTQEVQDHERRVALIKTAFESDRRESTRRYQTALSLYEVNRQRLTDKIEHVRSIKPGDPAPLKARLSDAQADAQKAQTELDQVEKKLENFLAEKTALEFWLTGFGNRGCKSLLYTALIDRLNNELAKLCDTLSGGTLRLRLLPYTELAKGDSVERINLEVSNYLGANTFDGDSLGERNRIDIAVALGLRRVLMAFSGYAASLLFVDEPWVGLDNAGKASVYALLANEASNTLLFATDQDKSSKGFAEGKILTVRKANRISTLQE